MKLLPAAALLTFCMGWMPMSLAYPQAVAKCLDSNNAATCVPALPDDVRGTQSEATTGTMQGSTQTPATFDTQPGTFDTDSAATASTVATLGLFGSALVILGFFHGKRSVHRQLH
jgi:hypothetical protein